MRRLLLMPFCGVGLAVLPQAVASAADFTVNSNGDQTDAVPGNGTCATAGKGRDKDSGGSGADTIRAKDKTRDVIRWGAGSDVVFADKVDRVGKDCERVRRR